MLGGPPLDFGLGGGPFAKHCMSPGEDYTTRMICFSYGSLIPVRRWTDRRSTAPLHPLPNRGAQVSLQAWIILLIVGAIGVVLSITSLALIAYIIG